jgi:hypothetical protein
MEEFGLGWALGGIAMTALVTTVGTWFVTRYQLRQKAETQATARKEELDRHGTYLAVRVATVLDPFVMACVEVVNDRGYRDQEGILEPEHSPPGLNLPQDVDWQSIDPHLMDRILSMPNDIASAEKTISFVGEITSGPPDYDEWFDERRYQWAGIGLKALDLARDLRERYKLPQRDYSRYDPRDTLEAAFRREDDMQTKGAATAKRIAMKAKAAKRTT